MTETRRESGSWKAKHHRILTAALDEFIERGFIGGSMDRIATKAKVSKVTIYNHFENKDLLYGQMVEYYLLHLHPRTPALEARLDQPPQEILSRFATQLIETTTNPRALGMLRLFRADPLMTGSVANGRETRLLPDANVLSAYLAAETGNGRLRVDNPDRAARQLIGMILENTLYPSLMGLKIDLSAAAVREVIESSVGLFLRHYGP